MTKKKHRRKRGRSAADFFGGRSTRTYEKPIIEEIEEGQTTEAPDREELLKELDILNLSSNTVTIVILATLLNYYYIQSLKAQTLDELYCTNYSKDFIDTEDFPKIVNTIFLYTTGVFLTLNYTLLQEIKCNHIDDLNNEEVMAAYRSFLASLFTMLAVLVSRNNLEL